MTGDFTYESNKRQFGVENLEKLIGEQADFKLISIAWERHCTEYFNKGDKRAGFTPAVNLINAAKASDRDDKDAIINEIYNKLNSQTQSDILSLYGNDFLTRKIDEETIGVDSIRPHLSDYTMKYCALRNLQNMIQDGVSADVVADAWSNHIDRHHKTDDTINRDITHSAVQLIDTVIKNESPESSALISGIIKPLTQQNRYDVAQAQGERLLQYAANKSTNMIPDLLEALYSTEVPKYAHLTTHSQAAQLITDYIAEAFIEVDGRCAEYLENAIEQGRLAQPPVAKAYEEMLQRLRTSSEEKETEGPGQWVKGLVSDYQQQAGVQR